jgi:hypothetical protein
LYAAKQYIGKYKDKEMKIKELKKSPDPFRLIANGKAIASVINNAMNTILWSRE